MSSLENSFWKSLNDYSNRPCYQSSSHEHVQWTNVDNYWRIKCMKVMCHLMKKTRHKWAHDQGDSKGSLSSQKMENLKINMQRLCSYLIIKIWGKSEEWLEKCGTAFIVRRNTERSTSKTRPERKCLRTQMTYIAKSNKQGEIYCWTHCQNAQRWRDNTKGKMTHLCRQDLRIPTLTSS